MAQPRGNAAGGKRRPSRSPPPSGGQTQSSSRFRVSHLDRRRRPRLSSNRAVVRRLAASTHSTIGRSRGRAGGHGAGVQGRERGESMSDAHPIRSGRPGLPVGALIIAGVVLAAAGAVGAWLQHDAPGRSAEPRTEFTANNPPAALPTVPATGQRLHWSRCASPPTARGPGRVRTFCPRMVLKPLLTYI